MYNKQIMLKSKIQEEMIKAVKSKDQTKLDALRFLLSEIKYAEIEKKGDFTDEETIKLLQKEVKKRQNALNLIKKSQRTDIIAKEEKQIEIIKSYLPEMISEEELEKVVDEIINQTPNSSNPGPIIGQVMARLKGKVEGSKVASLVTQKLQKKS